MPYDAETRRAALACLAAQEGNYRKAGAATGISVSTLRRWARQERQGCRSHAVAQQDAIGHAPAPPGDAQQQLEHLVLVNMLEDARQLAGSLQEVIDDAPLGQRATALNQLLDKILRIMALLPRQEEVLVRVEFQGEDGAAHEAPPWAGADSGQ
ncbi:MAG: helix-turn-helix domain-containing protein [Anaerolineaceae bacterium]|nr:helix-turn-helix domain-containing protein [Anaerolineaceae bacterium]MCY3907744.1 helix-turn-helix domain-containing protein [Anaerolineaceae bacterium]